MGSNFFGAIQRPFTDAANWAMGTVGAGNGVAGRGAQMGPNSSGWSAPSLAGANAGYGGVQPGTAAQPSAGSGPNYYAANPYVYAARQATGQ